MTNTHSFSTSDPRAESSAAPAQNSTTAVPIEVDLTSLGTVAVVDDIDVDLPADSVDPQKLIGIARSCQRSGISQVTFGQSYRSRSDVVQRAGAHLDPINAALQVAGCMENGGVSAGTVITTVSGAQQLATRLAKATARLAERRAYIGLHIDGPAGESLETVLRVIHEAPLGRGQVRPHITVTLRFLSDTPTAVRYADRIRVRTADENTVRLVRERVRQAAAEAGVDAPPVYWDVRTLIGDDEKVLAERAWLSASLAGENDHWRGAYEFTGTARELTEQVQRWISSGAIDGVTIIPASLPGDLRSILKVLVPSLVAV